MTDKEQREVFGVNLSYLVAQTGKEQKEVADELDIPPTTFNSWCTGKVVPNIKTLHMLADHFNCSILDLIDEHDENFPLRHQIVAIFRKHDEKNYMKHVLMYLKFLESNPEQWKDGDSDGK